MKAKEMEKLGKTRKLTQCGKCGSSVVRLDRHLRVVHKLQKYESDYRKLMKRRKKEATEIHPFVAYLRNTRGHSKRNSQQTLTELHYICDGDYSNIFNGKFIRHKLEQLRTQRTASTVRHYLTSGQLYLEFLTLEEPDIPAANMVRAQTVIRVLGKSLSKALACQREAKKSKINGNIIDRKFKKKIV
ncbi:uncharacterized protein LOC117103580 [Anneissia japonica]|uniref:uncharacterized protein LOC117103580 n=1 Tax=Anneissia japonica TaxID=1529436 RepID=UPI001425753B|nr:uncharacterized protein LOC117103580 [Anneissia japonica]